MNFANTIKLLVCTAALLAGAGCIPAGQVSSVVATAQNGAAFPRVTGINLEGDEVALPAGFAGRFNLVAVAFERQQQAQVDTWIAASERLRADRPGLRFYEVPTIFAGNALFRLWVNNGMRAGIPDPDARQRTITLYLDRERFKTALDIADTADIHVLLLDAAGRVLWRTTGPSSDQKLAALRSELAGSATGRQPWPSFHGRTVFASNRAHGPVPAG